MFNGARERVANVDNRRSLAESTRRPLRVATRSHCSGCWYQAYVAVGGDTLVVQNHLLGRVFLVYEDDAGGDL